MTADSNGLPRRVRADIGSRPPTLAYTARPYVIAKFLAALKAWNPDYTVEPFADKWTRGHRR